MRFVRRDPTKAPDVLTKKNNKTGKTETEEAKEHYGKWPGLPEKEKKAFDYQAYSHEKVKDALYEMFNYKCAYCETWLASLPMDVDHWRPKSAVFNEDTKKLMKPGYYWLGAEWSNLFPSCADCNRARNHKSHPTGKKTKLGKANRFPLQDENRRWRMHGDQNKETPLLLNPCQDKPENHLEFIEEGVVRAKLADSGKPCEKAVTSIEVYGLNRPILVFYRQELLKHVKMHMENIEEFTEDILAEDDPGKKRKLEKRIAKKKEALEELAGPKHQYTLMVKQEIEKFSSEA